MNNDDMRGLFFIIKGQFRKGAEPSFINKVSGDVSWIGGYDPNRDTTEEWYMLMDCKTFNCLACGSDLNKVLRGVRTAINKYKGVAKKYFKHISDTTSDDYYETHYLGRTPLSHEGRLKKAEGRCPRVSPIMRCLYEQIYSEYGDYYRDEIEEMEDLAYSDLREEKPIHKSKKLMAKTKKGVGVINTLEKQEKVIETPTLKKMVKPKVKLGMKKLKMV